MRWWKHCDELLMMRLEREATTASDEVRVMMRTYKKQVADRTAAIDFLQCEAKYINGQIKDIDEKKLAEERTAKGKLKLKVRELEKVHRGVEKLQLKTQLLPTEEVVLKQTLDNKANASQTLTMQLKAMNAELLRLEAELKDKMKKARNKLILKKRTFQEITDQCEKYQALITHPPTVDAGEQRKRDALQSRLEQARRDQVSYGQQLEIIQGELHRLDRTYNRRYQTLHKIDFKLRNETYVRRLLERKF
ncbi:hypothetical protein BV898_19364 [Hypsibius exemplaris]|uniref:Uncharacterized protein n=1 Tax=Hypsibius exemplaris TaxID=2072580 RepID=A0A9X6NJF4_HYPEX|nr:hypothetical protein BV898_19364 [Hypsibius exemplaris]